MNQNKSISTRVKIILINLIQEANWPNIKLSEYISEKIGMPYIRIGRIFKLEEGDSILEWLSKEKIHVAKRLIRQGEKNFIDISTDLGFSSNGHFSTVFKRITKMSPSVYKLIEKQIKDQ